MRIPETPIPGAFMPLGGVAVIAKNTWAAIKGREALKVTWDHGTNAAYDSTTYKATLEASVRKPGDAGRTNGNAAAASPPPAASSQPSTTSRTSRTPRWSRWRRLPGVDGERSRRGPARSHPWMRARRSPSSSRSTWPTSPYT
ncbi:MAG: hypothetical protein IPK33_25735 [Gemmatimonadetes bacterium]|nr:hypothetical protein [Gemmatimonadota bacterium]